MPIRRAWRGMHAGQVVVLVTSAALHRIHSLSIRTAPDLHGVLVAVISLAGKVSRRVAIHAAGMTQYGNDIFEGGSGRSIANRGLCGDI